jgi:hypothetical protein
LRVFGCLAFVNELKHVKVDKHSSPGIFIGYVEEAKVYHVLDPASRRVHVARDILFDQGRG